MIIALLAASVLALTPSAFEWFNDKKSFEITLQFLFIVVLGGGVAFFYREMESRRAREIRAREEARERMEAKRAALDGFRQSLIETFHSAKKVRRSLRAASYPTGDGDDYGCLRDQFEQLMDQLEEAQLRAEALTAEVDARHDLFGTHQEKKDLRRLLKMSNAYLRCVLRYYEDGYAERYRVGENQPVLLSSDLLDFIGRHTTSNNVMEKFYEPMDEARRRVVALIERNIPSAP